MFARGRRETKVATAEWERALMKPAVKPHHLRRLRARLTRALCDLSMNGLSKNELYIDNFDVHLKCSCCAATKESYTAFLRTWRRKKKTYGLRVEFGTTVSIKSWIGTNFSTAMFKKKTSFFSPTAAFVRWLPVYVCVRAHMHIQIHGGKVKRKGNELKCVGDSVRNMACKHE